MTFRLPCCRFVAGWASSSGLTGSSRCFDPAHALMRQFAYDDVRACRFPCTETASSKLIMPHLHALSHTSTRSCRFHRHVQEAQGGGEATGDPASGASLQHRRLGQGATSRRDQGAGAQEELAHAGTHKRPPGMLSFNAMQMCMHKLEVILV
jgi:hypothetical protein